MSPFLWLKGIDVQIGWALNSGKTKFAGFRSIQIGRLIILWRAFSE